MFGIFNVRTEANFGALVYDIFPTTTAVTDYATGFGKLSAKGKFFPGAQIAVSF